MTGSYYPGAPSEGSGTPIPAGPMPTAGTTPAATRQDTPTNVYVPTLSMDFVQAAPPAPIVSANGFSVRWTGSFAATASGTYTFSTNSDDGVRVYINGVEVINDWYFQTATTASGSINLTNGTKYSVVVEYFASVSPPSNLTLSYTGPPQGFFWAAQLSATPGNGQVMLSWAAPGESIPGGSTYYPLSGYTVSYSTSLGQETTASGTTTSQFTGTTKTITGLTNGVTYYFIVTSDFANGYDYPSTDANSEARATPNAPAGMPTGVTTTPGYNQMLVSWIAPSGPVSGYAVAYKPDAGSSYLYAYTPDASTSMTITGLIGGTLYDFYVFAENKGVYGAYSPVNKNTPLQPPFPSAPLNLSATPGNAAVALAWTASVGAVSYNVQRSLTHNGPYTTITPAGAVTGTTYTDPTAINRTNYYYVVTATNGVGTSSVSNEAGATPDAADDAQFVSQTLSNGTAIPLTMTSGQTYMVATTMQNIGTSPWVISAPGSGYFLGGANPGRTTTWNSPDYVASTAPTPRWATQTFTYLITAPPVSTPTVYNFQRQMFHWGYPFFGDLTNPNLAITVNPAPFPAPVISVQTGSWQPSPALVGQTITSTVTASVTANPYQSPNGDSISQHWAWFTFGVYESGNGQPGSFFDASNYSIGWSQGSATTQFNGSFRFAGYYVVKVTAVLTLHDDTTGANIGTYSAGGYIGGSSRDIPISGDAVHPVTQAAQPSGFFPTTVDGMVVIPSTMTLGAHSTVDTSAPGNPWDPTHPRFFSGTNCSATGTAPAISGYVSQAHLLVGGTDVKGYYDTGFVGPLPPGSVTGTNQTSASLTVHFDSTHFANASSVPIQMTADDTAGNTYATNISASAYNEGYVGYEPTTVSGQGNAQVVAAAMNACQIGANNSGTADNRDAVLIAVKFNTVFFTCNHGNETPDANNHIYFESPAGVGNSNGLIYGNQSVDPSSTQANPRNDAAEAVASKSINPPPYNFVYLDVCNGALNTELANGFGISASGNSDRAFLGWSGVVADNLVNLQWTGRLYTALASGQTLNASIAAADTADPMDNVPMDQNTHSPCLHPIVGDPNMTLHGTVYQGVTGNWFK